jgi:glycosyltransferase involved in cell wall biosynthesis/SAM-dependent methyltransferase
MTTAKKSPRLFICDPNIRCISGHCLGYAQRIAEAAKIMGIQPWIISHWDIQVPSDISNVIPLLNFNGEELSSKSGEDPLTHLVLCADQWATALKQMTETFEIGEHDVMFFPFANVVQAWAVARWHRIIAPQIPRSVFIFRIDFPLQSIWSGMGTRQMIGMLRQAVVELTAGPGFSKIRFYTDSELLSEDYTDTLKQRFQTAPIPVDTRFVAKTVKQPSTPLRLLYIGEARTEKGYQMLPLLAERLKDRLCKGEIQLVVQTSPNIYYGLEPGIPEARAALETYPGVTILKHQILDEEYVNWMHSAHLVLLPYTDNYFARTSGVLAESIHAAIPAIVPSGTWLSEQLRIHGAGQFFQSGNIDSLTQAVTVIIEDYVRYAEQAFSRRNRFLSFHNPERLARFVCGEEAIALGAGQSVDLNTQKASIIKSPLPPPENPSTINEIQELWTHLNENKKENDLRYQDIMLLFDRLIHFSQGKALVLQTDYPIALDSNDHKFPHGTKNDNTRSPRFVVASERHFPSSVRNGEPLRYMDLGCSGGGLVFDFLLREHEAVGIEGSNFSQISQRAEWRILSGTHLFTADIAKPFSLKYASPQTSFSAHVISAWEFLEHIREEDLAQVFENIHNHLIPGGLFIGSIALYDDVIDGISYHPTVKTKEWWAEKFKKFNIPFTPEHSFEFSDFCRGTGNGHLDHDFSREPEAGFHFVAKKPLN